MKRHLLLLFALITALFTSAEQRDGYFVELVQFSGHNAYLLTPSSAGLSSPETLRPAVLVLHDHGAWFTIGKEKMACPVWREDLDSLSNVRIQAESKHWVDKYYHGMFVADSLAKAGFVVLVTDALYWGERSVGTDNKELKNAQQTFYDQHLRDTGEAWFETILREDREAVDYLCSLPYVDTTRIFTFGFSMGAYRSWQLAAADPRIAGCAAANWMTTIRYTGGFITGVSSWSMYRPLPEGAQPEDYDYPNIASRVSPRAFLLLYGTRDHVLPARGTRMAIRTIRRQYKSRQFRPVAIPADHEFTPDHYRTLLSWLKIQLPN